MRSTEVVIVGSGFGGLAAAKRLAAKNVRTTLITATGEHLFQPLLYQVATGVLRSEEIAPSIADVLARHETIDVITGRVVAVDAERHVVTYVTARGPRRIRYERLIAATGAAQAYFGHDEWAERTFALKTRDDAIALRRRIADAFAADGTGDGGSAGPERTFVVVGAGATGVEMAGQIRELAARHYDADPSVYLVEGAGDVLPFYGGRLSAYTRRTLAKAGVEVLTDTVVTEIADGRVTVAGPDGERVIAAETVVWSAGVQATPFAGILAEATGCDTDRAGRLLVNPDLTVGGCADVYAIGDMTSLNGYPGQSPVAMQQGRHVADVITRREGPGTPFRYRDKGSMAVVNRFNAVVDAPLGVKLTGVVAWFAWLAVHLFYLVGFRNRFAAVGSWFLAFIGTGRPGFAEDAAAPADDRMPLRRAA